MKRLWLAGLVLLLLTCGFLGWRGWCCSEVPRTAIESVEEKASPWVPTDAELAAEKEKGGVGWVFGRMIGIGDAPGSPNHSPFGSSSQHASPTNTMPAARR